MAFGLLLVPVTSRAAESASAPTATVAAATFTTTVAVASTTTVVAVTSGPVATYDGTLRAEYDYHSQGGAHDSDLYGYFSAGGQNMEGGLLDFYLSGLMHRGLSSSDNTLKGLDDIGKDERIQQAYLDVNDKPDDMQLRLGRQYIDVADYLTIDGAQAILFENSDLGGRLYFGAPVNFYSSQSNHVAFGTSVVGTPWEGNRTRLTYAQYGDASGDTSDHSYFADMRQEVVTGVQVRGQLSILDDRFSMGSLDASCFTPNGDTDLFVGGSRWGTTDAKTLAYSPLTAQLGEQDAYTFVYARLSQALTRTLSLSPGVSYRLADDGGSGATDYSNRSYGDYDLTLNYEPSRVFSSSLSVQYWDVSGGDKFVGLSGEVTYRKPKVWEVGAGCEYAAYTYNYYSDITYVGNGGQTSVGPDGTYETSPYAMTYFVRAKWNVTRSLALRASCDLEHDQSVSALGVWARASAEVKF